MPSRPSFFLSPYMSLSVPLLATVLLVSAPTGPLAAQEPPDSVRAELDRLRARLDSLQALVERLRAEGREGAAGDALADLRAAAAAAAAQGVEADTTAGGQPEFAGRQRSLQSLNPEISVNADIFAHIDQDDTSADNFVPREFEISLQSALDPFSRAKIFLSRHAEGPEIFPFEGHGHEGGEDGEEEGHADEGGGFSVEEGYVEWIGLPGGVGLKLGRFFQRFGQLNRWHAHALPFQSRSLPHLAFIGEEPLAQTGVSASWLAPFGGTAGTYEASVEVTRSSNENLFGESTKPSVLGHLNGFWQLSRATDLDLGLSWIHGEAAEEDAVFDRSLFGAEMAFTWRPPERARYREFVFRGGVMVLDGLHAEDGAQEAGEGDALGLWTMGELRLSSRWLVGARYDWTENPADPEDTAWLVSPTLTWWQSEWVRLRLEYDLLGRSALDDDEGRLWLQVTFAMGPHKHENY